MTETDYKLLQLLWEDPKLGTVLARTAILAIVVSIILERRTKVKPWTHLIRWIGGVANAPLIDRINGLSDKVDALQKDQQAAKAESERADREMEAERDLDKTLQARRRILRFSDEITNGIEHSQEMFNDILEDIDTYESYYRDHPGTKNGRAVMAVENVRSCFRERVDKNDFLVGTRKKFQAIEGKTSDKAPKDIP